MWFIWELHNGQLRANSDARSLRRTLRRPQNLRRAQSWVRQYATISSLSSLSFFWVEEAAQEAFKNFRKEKAFQIVLQPNFPARSYDKQITFPKAIRVEIGMLKKALLDPLLLSNSTIESHKRNFPPFFPPLKLFCKLCMEYRVLSS